VKVDFKGQNHPIAFLQEDRFEEYKYQTSHSETFSQQSESMSSSQFGHFSEVDEQQEIDFQI